jgi:hypothetical protein
MMAKEVRDGLTRRDAMVLTGSAAAVAMAGHVPVVAAADMVAFRHGPDDAARREAERLWIRLAEQLRGRLRVFREEYEDASRHYLATGDGDQISHVRLRVRSRLGFHLGFGVVTDHCRATFREVGDFIALLEREFPEVEWDEGTRKRFATLREWAYAGGQYATLTRKT